MYEKPTLTQRVIKSAKRFSDHLPNKSTGDGGWGVGTHICQMERIWLCTLRCQRNGAGSANFLVLNKWRGGGPNEKLNFLIIHFYRDLQENPEI